VGGLRGGGSGGGARGAGGGGGGEGRVKIKQEGVNLSDQSRRKVGRLKDLGEGGEDVWGVGVGGGVEEWGGLHN